MIDDMEDSPAFEYATPDYVTPREERGLTEPPEEWYVAIGRAGEPIKWIMASEEFCNLGDGLAGLFMTQWNENSLLSKIHKDDNSPEDQETIRQRIDEATEALQRITGFTPEEIWAKKRVLERQYIGQREAPTLHTEFITPAEQ